MPQNPFSNVLRVPGREQDPLPPPITVDLPEESGISFENGASKTELPDGSVVIDLEPRKDGKPKSDKFSANLAEEMDEPELNKIASELLEGIDRDNQSRQDHLTMISEGIKLLGLIVESNTASAAQSAAPLEGMSTVRHPLLIEACQNFQANATAALLPAAGPVKVRDDKPQKPEAASMMGHNGGSPLDGSTPFTPATPPGPGVGAPGAGSPAGAGMLPNVPPPMAGGPAAPQIAGGQPQPHPPNGPAPQPPMPQGAPAPAPMAGAPAGIGLPPPPAPLPEDDRDELANALEKDFNHYLTVIAKEYVPDTDQMLFKIGFGGLGIKKVYNCPLRRRPVSESVDVEDFIVSNALTDLSNAGRITHRIKMRPSTLKRMQILGVYRDVAIGQPAQSDQSNPVDQSKAEVAGVQPTPSDPRDMDHEVYECYCELDLDEFSPRQFKGKGLPLPYKVTIEKESRKVLDIRRNWREDDKECLAKEYFVDFPYMRAFGFYGIGLLHLLGNTTKALTALWREFIDAGMFANFPGFLYLKGAGRQLSNEFRIAPGSGQGLDANVDDITKAVMPLPYKSPDGAFTAFVQHIEELGSRLGGAGNVPVAEMRADAPVGTTLALLEQAAKPESAVARRLLASQGKEIKLLKDRFRDDPEAFWRFNKKPAMPWEKDRFIRALEDYDLVPITDPNNPTKMHRMAKAEAYKQGVAAAPQLFDLKKATIKYFRDLEIGDAESTMIQGQPQPPAPPIDPAKMADVQHKNQKAVLDAQSRAATDQIELKIKQMEMADRAADRENALRIAQLSMDTERLRLASTIAIHSDKIDEAQRAANLKLMSDHVGRAADQAHELRKLATERVAQQTPEAGDGELQG